MQLATKQDRWWVGRVVVMSCPTGERSTITRTGTITSVELGLVLVATMDGQQHLFEAVDGTLVHSPELGARWVLR